MALEKYRAKRDFSDHPEPRGRVIARATHGRCRSSSRSTPPAICTTISGSSSNGVLLSWAVPKGPSLDPADKRLAMHVEDHPIEYGDFEGSDSRQAIRRRHGDAVGPRNMDPKGDPVAGYAQGPSQVRARRREAQRRLDAGAARTAASTAARPATRRGC